MIGSCPDTPCGPRRNSSEQPAFVVANASWYLAASTMVRGLRALGFPTRDVVQDSSEYAALNFVHPGIVYGAARLQPLTAHQVFAQTRYRPTQPHQPAVDPAAAALMRDDATALLSIWQEGRFSTADTTALLCAAAAAGAQKVCQAMLQLLRSRLSRQALVRVVNCQDGEPIGPNGEPFNNSPLHYATMARQLPLCDLLLQAGADADLHNGVNTTPIQDAARMGDLPIFARLHASYPAEKAGVALTQQNVYGDTVMHRLAEYAVPEEPGYLQIYGFCKQQGEAIAAQSGMPFAALLDTINDRGFTALDMATARGQSALVRALVADGAQHSVRWNALPAHERTHERCSHAQEWLLIQQQWAQSGREAA